MEIVHLLCALHVVDVRALASFCNFDHSLFLVCPSGPSSVEVDSVVNQNSQSQNSKAETGIIQSQQWKANTAEAAAAAGTMGLKPRPTVGRPRIGPRLTN